MEKDTKAQVNPNVQQGSAGTGDFDIFELLYRLLDHWKLIIFIAILGGALAWAYTNFYVEPKYTSTASIYLVPSSDSVVNVSDLQLGSALASDYLQVFKTREVSEQVVMNLDLPYTYETMLDMFSVTNPTNTRILQITVDTTDPEFSSKVANEYASVASDYIARVMQTNRPTTLSAAVPATSPSSPNMIKNTIVGAFAGAFLVIGIIALVTILDNKVKSASDLSKLTGLPVFAQIPYTEFEETARPVRSRRHSNRTEGETESGSGTAKETVAAKDTNGGERK